MKEADEEEALLRRYLLGELDEGARERVEERFISDREFRERALMAEDELVEDYLAGGLPRAEHELFVGHFLSTPDQRRKLKIAGSLKTYLTAEAAAPPHAPGGEVLPPGGSENKIEGFPFWRKPIVLVPASLGLLLAVAFGLLYLAGVRQRQSQLAEVRRELEQLAGQPSSAATLSLYLTPLNLRGGGESSSLTPPAAGAVVQFWLVLVKDEYRSYEVVFQREGDAEQFRVGGLHAEATPRGRAVPVKIPARLLGPGGYALKLNGSADGGRGEEIGEYNFRVAR